MDERDGEAINYKHAPNMGNKDERWLNWSETAKQLNLGIGRNNLIQELRGRTIIIGKRIQQELIDKGYFRIVRKEKRDRNKKIVVGEPVILVSFEGINFLRETLKDGLRFQGKSKPRSWGDNPFESSTGNFRCCLKRL
jgi:hypothetical protein